MNDDRLHGVSSLSTSGAVRFVAAPMMALLAFGGAASSAEQVSFTNTNSATEAAETTIWPDTQETAEIAADPVMTAAIKEGDDAVASGDVVDLDEFRQIVNALRS